MSFLQTKWVNIHQNRRATIPPSSCLHFLFSVFNFSHSDTKFIIWICIFDVIILIIWIFYSLNNHFCQFLKINAWMFIVHIQRKQLTYMEYTRTALWVGALLVGVPHAQWKWSCKSGHEMHFSTKLQAGTQLVQMHQLLGF